MKKNKWEAVRDGDHSILRSEFSVKKRFLGFWYTIADVYATPDGFNALENAERIAMLLNAPLPRTKGVGKDG